MKKRVKMLSWLMAVILCIPCITWEKEYTDVYAEDIVIYDAAEFECFRNRTWEEIGRKYGEALYAGESYVEYDTSTYYESMPSVEDPYAAGKLTEDTHKTMTAMTNFYRWLVGVEPLTVGSEHSDKLQAEALVRNFEFNHSVSDSSKPEDMSQELWDYGAKDYLHTILARYSTPRSSITSWMNEGYNLSYGMWDTVGHRYALIGASVSDVQFGYSGFIAAGQEKAYENTMNTPFSAFPAPGYMPNNLVYGGSSAWSIQINRDTLSVADSSEIVVKVTNLDTSESYECTTANRKLKVSGSILSFVQPAPGSDKRYTGNYRVDVDGLTDLASGKAAVLTYTTEFFDPTEYTPSYVKTVTADGIEKYIIYETAATTENLRKIAYALPSEVTVITENGRKAQVPVTGKWVLDEEKQCWTNQADAASLPEDITDREHVLEQCAIYYEISSSSFDAYNTLYISPSEPNVGDEVTMFIWLTQISADTSAIFQLIPQEDGTYIGTKRFDSRTSEEFDKEASVDYHIYHVSSCQVGDAGEYFSIFYNSSDTYAYVSTRMEALRVNVPGTDHSSSTTDPGTGSTPTEGTDSPAIGSTPTEGTDSPATGSTPTGGTDNGVATTDGAGSAKATAPAAPKISSLTAKTNGITVKWSKGKKASGYYVYRRTGKGSWKKVATIKKAATTSYTDKKAVKNGTTYQYKIYAYSTSGKTTTKSKASAAKTMIYLKAPKLSGVTNNKAKSATVKYGKNAKASGYEVCYSTSSKFAKGNITKKVSSAKTVKKMLSSLKKGRKYYVRVRACKKSGKTTYYSAWSDSKSVKITK